MVSKRPRVKIRKLWGPLNPTTRVIKDKSKRPYRKRKHKGKLEDEF